MDQIPVIGHGLARDILSIVDPNAPLNVADPGTQVSEPIRQNHGSDGSSHRVLAGGWRPSTACRCASLRLAEF